MRTAVPVALFLLTLSGERLSAQCVRASYPTYHQSYTPSYSYAANYIPPQVYDTPYYNYYTQTAVVGQAYPVYLPLLSYTSLADDVRGYYQTKRATKDGYLEALREAAAEGLINSPYPRPGMEIPTNPAPTPASPPAASVPPTPQPNLPTSPAKTPGKVQIAKVLQTRCAGCHNPQTEPNHIDLSKPADQIVYDPRFGDIRPLCVVYVTDGSMPKGKGPIPQEEYDALVAWAKSAPRSPKQIPPANNGPPIPVPPPANKK